MTLYSRSDRVGRWHRAASAGRGVATYFLVGVTSW